MPIPTAASELRAARLSEMFDTVHGLLQETKGDADGPHGGFVTDHLDAAENWLDRIEEAINQIEAAAQERIAALEGALKPFAFAAFEADGWADEEAFTLVLRPDDCDGLREPDEPAASMITARQLRLARALLAPIAGGGE